MQYDNDHMGATRVNLPKPPARGAARTAPPTWLGALAAAAVSGAALGAAFPSLGWEWLAWLALVPLWIVVARAPSAWRALWPGYLAGAVFFGVSCPWIASTIHRYGDLSPVLAGLVFFLFLALMGAYLALFALAGYWIGRGAGHRLLPLPFLWVAVEMLRTYTPMGGFPWNLLGYAEYQHPGFMLAAPVAGVYGVGFLIALANTLLAALALRFWESRGKQPVRWPVRMDAVQASALGLLLAFASWPYHAPTNPERALRAMLVQPNTPLDQGWSGGGLTRFLAAQQRLSLPRTPERPVNLIVWPEQPAPLDYAQQPEFQAAAAEMISRTRAAFLFSEVTYAAANYGEPRNSSLLVRADGTTGERYDKRHLVPFGEYVPLPGWFERIAGVGKLVQGVGDFVPGRAPVLFHIEGGVFSTLVCYESIFPALARKDVRLGAQWLVNQSDDSWYGTSSAAAQGLMMAQVRAMENRRWLLRDTNDGLTAVIDPYGRITAELPRFTAAALEAGFSPETRLTIYTRYGDWAAWLCVLISAALGALAAERRMNLRD